MTVAQWLLGLLIFIVFGACAGLTLSDWTERSMAVHALAWSGMGVAIWVGVTLGRWLAEKL